MTTQIDCATGFELRGATSKRADDGVAVEAGDEIMVWFAGVPAPIPMVVTKVIVEGNQKTLIFHSPMISKIEKAS